MELSPEPVGLGVPARMAMYQPTPRGDKHGFGTSESAEVPADLPEVPALAATSATQDCGEWQWTSLTVL